MNRRAKRRRTSVNYAKLAAGDYNEDDPPSGASSEDEPGRGKRMGRLAQVEEEEAHEEDTADDASPVKDVRKRRRKPRDGRSVRLKLPAAILEVKEETEPRSQSEKKRAKEERWLHKDKSEEKERERERKKEKERPAEKVKKKRLVTSDDSDEEEFGYDNDESEDFVPRKVRGQQGLVEEDDHVLDEDEEELVEAELEAIEEASKVKRMAPATDKGKGTHSGRLSSTPLERKPSFGREGVGMVLKPSPHVMVGPSLSRSLSGGRIDSKTLPSPSSGMMKGAQGRLLKKIGFKAPLVTASAVKVEAVRQKSLPKGGIASLPQDKKSVGVNGVGRNAQVTKESTVLRPWFSTPGSGKWDRKSTAFLDDATLFSQARSQPGPGADGDPSQQGAPGVANALDDENVVSDQVEPPEASSGEPWAGPGADQVESQNGGLGTVHKQDLDGEGPPGCDGNVSEDGELVEDRQQIKEQIANEVEALVGDQGALGLCSAVT